MDAIDNHSQLWQRNCQSKDGAWLIVCVCNRLNEAKIRAAVAAGMLTPDDIFAYYRVSKNCGKCLDAIEELAWEDEGEHREALAAAE